MQDKDSKIVDKGRPKSATGRKVPVVAERPSPVNIQNFVDKKLQPTKTVEVPAHAKFPNAENDAYNWSIVVMVKYLKDNLELPQYSEAFKRHEISGQKFISMNEANFTAADVTNKFHAMKLDSHSERLRELVLERAHVERPDSELDWGVPHLAAWLAYDKSCPETAIRALKGKLNGYKLKDMSGKEAVASIGAADLEEASTATACLEVLAKAIRAEHTDIESKKDKPETNRTEILSNIPHSEADGEDNVKKKEKKSKTAIQKRREKKQQALADPASVNLDDSADDAELRIVRNDSLPVVQRTAATSSSTKGASVSGLLSDTTPVRDARTNSGLSANTHMNNQPSNNTLTTINELTHDNVVETRKVAKPVSHQKPHSLLDDGLDGGGQELPDVSGADIFRMDGYKKSKERKKFLSKITSLRKIVAEHAETMNDLREQASILKSENMMIKQQQKLLLQEGGASQELIATLVNDRNVALLELEKVVSLYDEHTSREREEVVRDLRSLAKDTFRAKSETEEIWRSCSMQLTHMGSLEVDSSLASPAKPARGPETKLRKNKS